MDIQFIVLLTLTLGGCCSCWKLHLIVSILIVPLLKRSYKNHTHKEGPVQFDTHFEGPSFPSFQASLFDTNIPAGFPTSQPPGYFTSKVWAWEHLNNALGQTPETGCDLLGPLTLKYCTGTNMIYLSPWQTLQVNAVFACYLLTTDFETQLYILQCLTYPELAMVHLQWFTFDK